MPDDIQCPSCGSYTVNETADVLLPAISLNLIIRVRHYDCADCGINFEVDDDD